MTIKASEIPNESHSSFVYSLNHFHSLFQDSLSLMFSWRTSEYPVMFSWGFKLKFVSFQEHFFPVSFLLLCFFPLILHLFLFPVYTVNYQWLLGTRWTKPVGSVSTGFSYCLMGDMQITGLLKTQYHYPSKEAEGRIQMCCEGSRRNAAVLPKIFQ